MRFSLYSDLMATSSWITLASVYLGRAFQRALANDVSVALLQRGGQAS